MKLNFRNPLWLILNEKLMNLWINSKIFVFLGASKFYCKKANFFSDFTKQKKNFRLLAWSSFIFSWFSTDNHHPTDHYYSVLLLLFLDIIFEKSFCSLIDYQDFLLFIIIWSSEEKNKFISCSYMINHFMFCFLLEIQKNSMMI